MNFDILLMAALVTLAAWGCQSAMFYANDSKLKRSNTCLHWFAMECLAYPNTCKVVWLAAVLYAVCFIVLTGVVFASASYIEGFFSFFWGNMGAGEAYFFFVVTADVFVLGLIALTKLLWAKRPDEITMPVCVDRTAVKIAKGIDAGFQACWDAVFKNKLVLGFKSWYKAHKEHYCLAAEELK